VPDGRDGWADGTCLQVRAVLPMRGWPDMPLGVPLSCQLPRRCARALAAADALLRAGGGARQVRGAGRVRRGAADHHQPGPRVDPPLPAVAPGPAGPAADAAGGGAAGGAGPGAGPPRRPDAVPPRAHAPAARAAHSALLGAPPHPRAALPRPHRDSSSCFGAYSGAVCVERSGFPPQRSPRAGCAPDARAGTRRSGALPLEEATLHVVLAATHAFDKDLVDTVVQVPHTRSVRHERSLPQSRHAVQPWPSQRSPPPLPPPTATPILLATAGIARLATARERPFRVSWASRWDVRCCRMGWQHCAASRQTRCARSLVRQLRGEDTDARLPSGAARRRAGLGLESSTAIRCGSHSPGDGVPGPCSHALRLSSDGC
jgi:hypothetical protein